MTCWIAVTIASVVVEVGRDCHIFYCGSTENSVGL
jgi:hypothetical protein